MKWEFNDDTPIYLQIMEHIKTEIASGGLKAGDKIPPVRELAMEAESFIRAGAGRIAGITENLRAVCGRSGN